MVGLLLNRWFQIGVLLAALGAMGFFLKEANSKIVTLNELATTYKDERDKAQAQTLALKTESETTLKAISDQKQKAVERMVAAQRREKQIRNSLKDGDNAPISPVLMRSLTRINELLKQRYAE